jgi:hypothetical protein
MCFEIASLRARLAFFDLSEEIDAMSPSEKTGGNASGGWRSSHSTTGGHCIIILENLWKICGFPYLYSFFIIIQKLLRNFCMVHRLRPTTCSGAHRQHPSA